MLNEKDLGKILGISFPPLHIQDIHWKSQDSDKDSILFYRIGSDQKAKDQFALRLQDSKFAWLIVNEPHDSLPKNSSVVDEESWNDIQKKILDVLYPIPTLKFLALTGTNGKTTTTDLVLQLGELAGKKGFSIGTLGVRQNQKTILDFGMTSPGLIDLRKYIFLYGQKKDFCVMEASSHALVQNRLYGICFDGAGWLSFSQDHLDYHQTMNAYFDAKCLLIQQLNEEAKIFVPHEQVDLYSNLKKVSKKTTEAPVIPGKLPVFFSTRFNRNNLEVASAMVEDVFKVKASQDYEKLSPPDGRFFIRAFKSNYIVVDFAHTPDALDNICRAIHEAFPGYYLKVLFGCGGDRDRSKRPLMAQTVAKWANEIIVTSDNPRSEDPDQIIDDIVAGIPAYQYRRVTKRPEAVQSAFEDLKEKEILLLAGKGHEDYILIQGIKHPYSDIQEVEMFLARKIK